LLKLTDYICDEEDTAIIESITNSDDKRIVVRVGDSFVSFFHFKCLLSSTDQIYDDVSSIILTYITKVRIL